MGNYRADEDEVFDSDFRSTDEEAMKEDEAAGEKEVVEEEKHARRSARHHAMKAIETFSARRRTAPSGQPSGKLIEAKSNVKPKMMRGARRVSLGGAIDVETGESVRQRQSRRKSTILSSQSLHSRLKDAEERKASMPKRTREIAHTYTQAELIARALDAEEGNIVEHRDYLMQEEEKRRRARVVRQSISGPVLRWVSRSENEKVPIEPPASSTTILDGHGGDGHSGFGLQRSIPITPSGVIGYSTYQPYGAASLLAPSYLPAPLPPMPLPSPSNLQFRTERVMKNYLLYELGQEEGAPKPNWGETMATVFGTHVNWEEVKVYSGKHRPLSRPVTKCPLTGRPAIYRDPRSGVPFANVGAFKTLTRILAHEYVWNEELKCYTASEKDADSGGRAVQSSSS
ncbi:hypothetical protein M0805_007687 [Coniferiporia weirii]|nr:hypothetical protein M0805_007687 [Coniferiporia weirii]